MQIQDEWDEVMREIKQRWDQLARDPQFLRELDAVGEIETYLEQMDIELGRASGPYYLTECYHLYRVEAGYAGHGGRGLRPPHLPCAPGAVPAPAEAGGAGSPGGGAEGRGDVPLFGLAVCTGTGNGGEGEGKSRCRAGKIGVK